MKIADKTKEQLVEGLKAMRLRIAELEKAKAERKQREEAIREIEREKLSILNTMSEHVVYQNRQHRILWANEAAAQSAGLSREQLVGCYCYEIWYKRNEPCVGCPVAKARETGKLQASEMTTPDGRAWLIRGYPVRDTEDRIVGLVEVVLEITERKQVEEALLKGEKKYELLFGSTLDGMFVLDAETMKVVLANQAAVDIYGLNSVEEAIGANPLDFVPPEERERVLRIIVKDMFDNDLRQVNEFRGITKDGREIWISAVGTRTEYQGKLAGLVSFSDITERKRMEEEIRISEEKYRHLFENLNDAAFLADAETGQILETNRQGEALLGMSRNEIVGLHQSALHPPGKAEEYKERFATHVAKGRVADYEGEVIRKDEAIIPVAIGASSLTIHGRRLILGLFHDITERKRTEEELRKMFESVTDGISVIDLNGIITEANQRAVEMHGFGSKKELLGKSALELVAPHDHERIATNMRKTLKEGTIRGVEYTLLKADGSEFPGELSTSVLKDTSGNPVGHITIARDVTERKKAEQVLRQSEEKYRTIFENVNDVVVRLDKRGKIIDANKRIEDYFGYKPEEIIGNNFTKLGVLSLKDLPKIARLFAERVKGKGLPFIELEVKRKDSSTAVLEASTTLVKKNGKIEGTVAIIHDITERKKAEQALADEATRRRILVEQSRDGIVVLDQNGKVYEANQRFADMLGYSGKEVRQLSVFDWEYLYPREQVLEMIRTVDEAGDHFETQHRRKDGSTYDVEISTNAAAFAGQKLIFCVCRDITERKQAEELYRTLANSSPIGVYIVQDGKFQFVNPQFQKYTGFTEDELLDKESSRLVHPEDRERVRKNAVDMLKGKRLSPYELRYIVKNGEILWATETVTSIQYRGKRAVLGNFMDITQRKQAEEEKREMEQKAHLASRLASVGEMAAGIAHEINNPLTSVIGFSQLLMEGNIPADVKEDVSIIHKEAQRAAGVAKNLLTFARKQAPAKQSTNMNSIIDGVLKLRAYEQRVSNIQVDSQLAPDLPEVMADYSQLQQVFINIIINAESAMIEANRGGTLTITTQRVNNTVRASFTDDGPGISKENLNRIFDPFFTTKEVGKGTGLGLSVCHGIIAEHGGRMYARSNPDKGATFVVELPVNNS